MSKSKKPNYFLKVPQYPGGNTAMKQFLDKNLQYPKEALEAKIEGEVEAEYQVDGLGNVKSAKILKGIGHGCNEEVIRLINLLIFEKAINRGYKTLTRKTLKIDFKLPKPKPIQITYNIVGNPKKENPPAKKNLGYTININYKK